MVSLVPLRTPPGIADTPVRIAGALITSDGRFQIYGSRWSANFVDVIPGDEWPTERKSDRAVKQTSWTIGVVSNSPLFEEDRDLLASVGLVDPEDEDGAGWQRFSTAKEAFAVLKDVAYPDCDVAEGAD